MDASLLRFALLLGLAVSLGCGQTPASVPVNTVVEEAAPAPATAITTPAAEGETWDAHYIGDDHVGYTQINTKRLADGNTETTSRTKLTIQRFRQPVTQTIDATYVETKSAAPLRYHTVVKSGSSVVLDSSGAWQDGKLVIKIAAQGQAVEQQLDWKPEYFGPITDAQLLKTQQLAPGDSKQLTAFLPSLNQIGTIELVAKDFETTRLLDGEAKLLRVEVTLHAKTPAGVQKLASTYWVDKEGELLKSYLPQLKQTSYRTSEENATKKVVAGSFDLADATIVKLKKPLVKPHQQASITYKATIPEGEIDGVFVAGPTQSIKLIDKQTCELTVHRQRPGEKLTTPDEEPTDDDRAPNAFVQSKDPLVVKMAEGVAADEKDPWKLAQALEAHVHKAINKKDFSQTFASAAQVAKDRQGDCTEHAVLLAALCRARGIPARGAMGLVYYPAAQGFAYHMWTEVWIDDRWIPLDATLGLGGIGGGHLKLAHSNLKGADAVSAFLPVFKVLGQLQLEVKE